MSNSDIYSRARRALDSLPWSIVLPAGCGKTELIAAMACLKTEEEKPVLILTHTNTGVGVIKKRLVKLGAVNKRTRVTTIDSWSKHFNNHFPTLADNSRIENTDEWDNVRQRALQVFRSDHIGDIVTATYSAIIVDEYQDCSPVQHEIVKTLSNYIAVGVLGDPLQGIFDFGEDGVISWQVVENDFPKLAMEYRPHRWIKDNSTLGDWLLTIRGQLTAGGTIDLSKAGDAVSWYKTSDGYKEEIDYIYAINARSSREDRVVIITPQAPQGYFIARRLSGIYGVEEEIQCRILERVCTAIDASNGPLIVAELITLAKSCMTKIPSSISLAHADYAIGTPKKYRANNKNADLFDSLNLSMQSPTFENIIASSNLIRSKGDKLYRKEAWLAYITLLQKLHVNFDSSAMETLQALRSRKKYDNNSLRNRSVSRTLLVKGQECTKCIIIGADQMSARHLYVALSRGVKEVTVFSSSPVINIKEF